jgi:aminoglycoside phosphotransferase (APT) family kinase protein
MPDLGSHDDDLRLGPQERALRRAQELLARSGLPSLQIQSAGFGSHHYLMVVEIDSGPLQLLRLPRSTSAGVSMDVLRSEAEAIYRAHETLPVPHPVTLLPSSAHPEGSLMPILPGMRASDLRTHGASQAEVGIICRELGRSLARLHRIRRAEGEDSWVQDLFGDLEEEQCLLHGDAHLGNLLVENRPKLGWEITGVIDWSFCRWGPPEADLVEMAICEAEPRPHLGRIFYESYVDAGGLPPREPVLRRALIRELERRLEHHAQAHETAPRDVWTRWLSALQRPNASATRIFDAGRVPGRGLA